MASSSISGRSPTSSISMDSSEPIPAWFEPDGCGCSGSRAHVVVSALLLVSFFIGFSFLFSFESIAWPSGPRITNADETQAVLFDSQLRQRRRTKLVLPVFISQAAASASRVTNTVCLGTMSLANSSPKVSHHGARYFEADSVLDIRNILSHESGYARVTSVHFLNTPD